MPLLPRLLLRVFPLIFFFLGGVVGLLGWLALVVFVVVLIVSVVREPKRTRSDSRHTVALEILRERYARGEMTKEDYDNLRRCWAGDGAHLPDSRGDASLLV